MGVSSSNSTPAAHVETVKQEGSNGVDKHHSGASQEKEKTAAVQNESQSNVSHSALANKESKKDSRDGKERSKDKDRGKDLADKREDAVERSREKRTKDRRDDRDERGYPVKLEREDEWTERDGANFNGGASVESPDPDRESKRRKTDTIVTSKVSIRAAGLDL